MSVAHIAQSVEHFLGKEEVTGSNPVVGSTLIGWVDTGLRVMQALVSARAGGRNHEYTFSNMSMSVLVQPDIGE